MKSSLLTRISLLALGLAALTTARAEDDDFLPTHSQPAPLVAVEDGSLSLVCNLSGDGGNGGWRLRGENSWHASGTAIGGLLPGNHWVEFKQISGYSKPASLEVDVDEVGESFAATYSPSPLEPGEGWLRVETSPEWANGVWRLAGEAEWKVSGHQTDGLTAGYHTVEFRGFQNWTEPESAEVLVVPDQTVVVERSYRSAGDPAVWPVSPLLDVEVNEAPHRYVGRIDSLLGSYTGIAVGQYTVLTCLEAVLDPATDNFADGVTWSVASHAGSRVPEPQVAAGYVLMTSISDPARFDPSNALVAIYFEKPVVSGGWSGMHVGASPWLDAGRIAKSAGYLPSSGLMQSTPEVPLSASLVPMAGVFTLAGFPELCGWPLMTQRHSGRYYPAAICIGSDGGVTSFRVIDSDVAEMVQAAEDTAILGDGGTGTDVPLTRGSYGAGNAQKGNLRVEMVNAVGAEWTEGNSDPYLSGELAEVEDGEKTIEFVEPDGFVEQAARQVTVIAGETVELLVAFQQTYQSFAASEFEDLSDPKTQSLGDYDGDGVVNLLEWAFGMSLQTPDAGVNGQALSGLPVIETLDGDNLGLTVHFFRRKSAVESGVTYEAQFSSGLDDGWGGEGVETCVSIDDEWERVSVTGMPEEGETRLFGRVSVEEPEASP